ncbi:MAG: response regulator transcription factor, partial [Bdellovibrionales bacterium]
MTKIKSEINLNLSSVQIIQDVFSPIISVLPKMKQRGEAGEVSSLRVLIVEDEAKLLNHLERMIRNEGFSTFTCTSFSALELLLNISVKRFDVVVLDRLLHGRDTATLITQIKHALPEAKVLILSAIDTPAEKAQLLDLGADDYVAKPFDSDELIARIRVLLRRATP